MGVDGDIGGICFDMDGVLVQSEEYWVDEQRTHILPTTAPNDDIPVSAIFLQGGNPGLQAGRESDTC